MQKLQDNMLHFGSSYIALCIQATTIDTKSGFGLLKEHHFDVITFGDYLSNTNLHRKSTTIKPNFE